jgi:peptide subunit release factor RF-3
VIDRRTDVFTRFTRTARGSKIAPEEDVDAERAAAEEGKEWDKAAEESGLLDAMGANVDLESFLAGDSTPVFAGSALTNFGVRDLTSTTSHVGWIRRCQRSCSRSRPTWTKTIATESPLLASARASSTAAWS